MRASAKVAIGSGILWIVFGLISSALVPSPNEFFADPEGSVSAASAFNTLSWLSVITAIVALAIFAYRSIMDKSITKTEYHGPVDNRHVATGGGDAVVAWDGATVTNPSFNRSVNNYGEIGSALDEIHSYIDGSRSIPDRDKETASLLISDAKEQLTKSDVDEPKLKRYLKNIVDIAQAGGAVTEGVSKAIAFIRSLPF